MVEIMFALSLLTVVAAAVALWTQVAARAAAGAAGPEQWQAMAEVVLQHIHDDMAAGDLDGKRDEPRVRIRDGELEIRTRASAAAGLIGPVVCRYRNDPTTDRLLLQQQSHDGTQRTRLLLDRVQEWNLSIDQEKRTLAVTITAQGASVSRRFGLP